MLWFRRIALFLVVNFLVIATISILMSFFNIQPYLTKKGLDYRSLMIFCLIWGMGGAFISLALSKVMAKWMMGVKIIDPNTSDPALRELVRTVHGLAQQARLSAMPDVGIYDSPEINAFATGPSARSSLVAVSSGLMRRMRKEEIEGVLAHEISHIANGDMVTMTLLQGIINAFVMFLARALAFVILRGGSRDSEDSRSPSPFAYHMLVFGLEMVLMVLGSLVTAWYSRFREFRADAGGAQLAGRQKMIAALESLQRNYGIRDQEAEQPAYNAFKISSHDGYMKLFASHPPLELRIERLKNGL